ncbi:MAG: winged helix-turn-helix domain-containing protein [Myxococcales bacterium]|nr:winged helix-turn-helix domain-containing protein [Myxococcales bacterium]
MRLRAGQVDLERGVIVREGRTVRLTPLEVRLLAYLADHPDRDISQEELLQQVWGYAPGVASRAVTATVHRLRVKIERDPAEPDHLLTVWAKGLRFELATIPSPTLGPPDRFVGREALLERVSSDLEQRRLVTLTGPGGIGKTRLAQQLGRRSPQPQLWVDATQARSATDLVREVAGALSLRASSATEGATRVGHALQARGPLRLVLDNLEGALDAAAQLLPGWLAEASDCTVLVTSREALRIAGEAAHAVGPLEAHAAAELFEERLPRGVTVDPSVRDDVLQPLDGWPLAIELAARLADVLPPSELARRLGAADGASSALSLLHADRRDRPQRHHSLYSVLQGSVDAVPPSAQRALTTLAVLRGPFGPSDVSALLGDTGWRDLRVLVHHSLVTRHARGHRLLEPVRAYALEALRRSPHQRAVHHAVHRFVVDAAQQRFDPAGGPPSRADLAWAHDHAADLRAAWERACRSDASQAGILAAALHVLYVNGGPLTYRACASWSTRCSSPPCRLGWRATCSATWPPPGTTPTTSRAPRRRPTGRWPSPRPKATACSRGAPAPCS